MLPRIDKESSDSLFAKRALAASHNKYEARAVCPTRIGA
jgi:hypothetical protein